MILHAQVEISPCTGMCKPGKIWGWVFDAERNMWVCATCRQPSFANAQYVRTCFSCGNEFLVPKYPYQSMNCLECD